MIQRFSSVFFLVLSLLFSMAKGQPASDSVLMRARSVVDSLCSPSFAGRGYQDGGAQKAAAYLFRQFKEIGISAVEGHNYSQRFQMSLMVVDKASFRAMGRTWTPGADFITYQGSGEGKVSGKISDLGSALPPLGPVNGKIVVLREALPEDFDQSPENKDSFKGWLNLHDRLDSVLARGPLAVIVIQQKLTFGFGLPRMSVPVISLLDTTVKKWKGSASLEISYTRITPFTENLVGFIPGSEVPDSFLVVSAHYDHLGKFGDAYFPGANDNASGISMLLEMARYFSQPAHRPRHSMVFIAFSGEEVGLVGSQYFVERAPWFPLPQIRFLLNLDLMGNGAEGITAVGGRDFATEFALLQSLNDSLKAVSQVKSRNNAPNSDHYYFLEKGVHGFFIYTLGGPPHYHDVKDTPDELLLSHFEPILQLLENLLIKLD